MLTEKRKHELLDTEDQYNQWIRKYEEDTVERWKKQAFEKWFESLTDEETEYLNDMHRRIAKAILQIIKDTEAIIERNKVLKAKDENNRNNAY